MGKRRSRSRLHPAGHPLPLLKVQLPAQFTQDGHNTRVTESLEHLAETITPEDRLVIMDMDLGVEEMHETVSMIRMDPATANIPSSPSARRRSSRTSWPSSSWWTTCSGSRSRPR